MIRQTKPAPGVPPGSVGGFTQQTFQTHPKPMPTSSTLTSSSLRIHIMKKKDNTMMRKKRTKRNKINTTNGKASIPPTIKQPRIIFMLYNYVLIRLHCFCSGSLDKLTFPHSQQSLAMASHSLLCMIVVACGLAVAASAGKGVGVATPAAPPVAKATGKAKPADPSAKAAGKRVAKGKGPSTKITKAVSAMLDKQDLASIANADNIAKVKRLLERVIAQKNISSIAMAKRILEDFIAKRTLDRQRAVILDVSIQRIFQRMDWNTSSGAGSGSSSSSSSCWSRCGSQVFS